MLEAITRVRGSRGIRMASFHGNFFVRTTDLLAMPAVPQDQSYTIEMEIDETITSPFIVLQTAILHTTCFGVLLFLFVSHDVQHHNKLSRREESPRAYDRATNDDQHCRPFCFWRPGCSRDILRQQGRRTLHHTQARRQQRVHQPEIGRPPDRLQEQYHDRWCFSIRSAGHHGQHEIASSLGARAY